MTTPPNRVAESGPLAASPEGSIEVQSARVLENTSIDVEGGGGSWREVRKTGGEDFELLELTFLNVQAGERFLLSLQLVAQSNAFGTGARITADGSAVPGATSIATTDVASHSLINVLWTAPGELAELVFGAQWNAFGDSGTWAITPDAETPNAGGGVVLTALRFPPA